MTVIAWLWARTVKSPNPAFNHVEVPLVRSFVLSSKKGKEAWVEPVIGSEGYQFVVRMGKQPKEAIAGTVKRTGGTFGNNRSRGGKRVTTLRKITVLRIN